MPTWTLWLSVGVPVLVLALGLGVRGYRSNNERLTTRMDGVAKSHIKLLGSCRQEFASTREFDDFRDETRSRFDSLDKKVDAIPQQVWNLVKNGGKQ